MYDTDSMYDLNGIIDDNVSSAEETEVEDSGQTESELTDTEAEADVSATESLAVADTPSAECQFTDVNICNKLDIIIMLLIVMIAIKMFSPLANNYKRGLNRRDDKG